MQNKDKKHNKIVVLARSKSNSIESKTSEALINNEIRHADFMTIIDEKRNYRELKESIRWRIVKEVILKKTILLKKVKKRHW